MLQSPVPHSLIDFKTHHDFSNKMLSIRSFSDEADAIVPPRKRAKKESTFTINLSVLLDVFKLELAEAMKNSTSSLENCNELCALLCDFLKNQDESKKRHPDYLEVYAYFSLLEFIFEYNLLVEKMKNNTISETDLEFLSDKIKEFESDEHVYHLKNPHLKQLHHTLFQLLQLLFPVDRISSEPRSVTTAEMQFHIERKTQNAKRFGRSYQGKLENPTNSDTIYGADPNAAKELVTKMKSIFDNKIENRTQILACISSVNGNGGHGEHVDVHYNAQQERLEIINVGSFHNTMQYHFLRLIKEELNRQSIPHHLYACQSDVQRSATGCHLFAYALGKILEKIPFKDFIEAQKKYAITQPLFSPLKSNSEIGNVQKPYPTIDGTHWFSVCALGDDAVRLADSFTVMGSLFTQMYGAKQAKQKVEEVKKKYDLHSCSCPKPEHKRTFLDGFAEKHLARYQHQQIFTLDTLRQKLTTANDTAPLDNALLVRRAIANSGQPDSPVTKMDMECLVKTLEEQAIQNQGDVHPLVVPGRTGLTPLQMAQQRGNSVATKWLASSPVQSQLETPSRDTMRVSA